MAVFRTLVIAMAVIGAIAAPHDKGRKLPVAQRSSQDKSELQDLSRAIAAQRKQNGGKAPPQEKLYPGLPVFDVPACLEDGPDLITFDKAASVPDKKEFPKTEVNLCWDEASLIVTFNAFQEPYFYSDDSLHTQGDTETYHESVGVLMARGDDTPFEYLDIQVDPNNITYTAFVYNQCAYGPLPGPYQCPLDIQLLQTPEKDLFQTYTELVQRDRKIWRAAIAIPLKIFNVPYNEGRDKKWRMNFSRTICGKDTCAKDAQLGAWSVPDSKKSMHQSKFFGHITFV